MFFLTRRLLPVCISVLFGIQLLSAGVSANKPIYCFACEGGEDECNTNFKSHSTLATCKSGYCETRIDGDLITRGCGLSPTEEKCITKLFPFHCYTFTQVNKDKLLNCSANSTMITPRSKNGTQNLLNNQNQTQSQDLQTTSEMPDETTETSTEANSSIQVNSTSEIPILNQTSQAVGLKICVCDHHLCNRERIDLKTKTLNEIKELECYQCSIHVKTDGTTDNCVDFDANNPPKTKKCSSGYCWQDEREVTDKIKPLHSMQMKRSCANITEETWDCIQEKGDKGCIEEKHKKDVLECIGNKTIEDVGSNDTLEEMYVELGCYCNDPLCNAAQGLLVFNQIISFLVILSPAVASSFL